MVVAMAAAAGCSKSSDKAEKAPPTSTVSTSTAPSPDRTALAKIGAAAAYVHMWSAAAAAYHAGKVTSPQLELYATDKALAAISQTGLYYQDHGFVMNGQPSSMPVVTSVDFSATPYTAKITDCLDSTHYVEVERKTGKAVPRGEGPYRHVTTAVARFNGKNWLISELTIQRDRTC
ncbi:hypothetical protein [Actinacidiphila rubida]|uniref:hypothetical protein n=1 Tax=Actinacidiphila rubida TaxID=310780 RepID=UPI0011607841|nr:hypothetical protein [Actinacidiphila rubida]